jgi:hypothetical protein
VPAARLGHNRCTRRCPRRRAGDTDRASDRRAGWFADGAAREQSRCAGFRRGLPAAAVHCAGDLPLWEKPLTMRGVTVRKITDSQSFNLSNWSTLPYREAHIVNETLSNFDY